ncbi:MAG: hypothetical protein WCE94_01805 [Candidatus Methanoperedens sp.]
MGGGAQNSYELRVKYFQLFGAPIEADATYSYRKAIRVVWESGTIRFRSENSRISA